ncbi:hypothetical protein [Paraliomyxa miuraensis]|uniref:hypothetical protein n=1 Tax=Paraliomyxa miuraensis TaxID=376150 RepID=UPI00224D9F46|nr:hypothetical protein [Paraliomyxa miuraensis]MCX4240150.1 hypothetical protein [Paraliomyxa miuraensis]
MTSFTPCLLVALATATPAIAFAGPAEVQPAAVDEPSPADPLESLLVVRVEVEGGEAVAELLRGEVLASLRKAGVTPELPEGAPLELVVSTNKEAGGAYEIAFLHRDLPLDSWTCACAGEELRARLQRAAPTMWQAAIAAAAPPPEPAPTTAPTTATERSPATSELDREVWLSGVVFTAVGTGMVVSTSALLIVRAADGEKTTGIPVALLSAGALVTAMGGTLWGIANRNRKRARLGLSAGRGVVVTLRGRF